MGYVSCCFRTNNFIKKFAIKDTSRQTNYAWMFANWHMDHTSEASMELEWSELSLSLSLYFGAGSICIPNEFCILFHSQQDFPRCFESVPLDGTSRINLWAIQIRSLHSTWMIHCLLFVYFQLPNSFLAIISDYGVVHSHLMTQFIENIVFLWIVSMI